MNVDTPAWRSDFDREFTAARLAMLLGLLMLISYPDIILGTHAFFYRDTGQFGYPVADYLRNSFWRGEAPLWNPYNDCGLPFLAQWNTLALYPPSLFYVLLPMPWAMNFFILGHVFLAGIGMYFLTLRWMENRFAASLAGLVFAWNGLAIHCWMWPCHIAALGWMPWVVLLGQRAQAEGGRAVILAALAGACQMVTGSPEIIVFTWLMVLGSVLLEIWRTPLFWRGVARLSGVVALVTALSAAQLLPLFDLLAHGDRTTASGDSTWAMPPWGVANFFAPLFRLTGSVTGVFMQTEQQWTTSYYVGVLTLVLAFLAVVKVRNARVAFLAIMAVAGVLCAMGEAGILLKILRALLPVLGLTRYPIKFVVITVFCLPLLAGYGVVWLQGQTAWAARRSLLLATGLVALAVVIFAFCVPFAEDSRTVVGMNGLVRLLILLAGVGTVFCQPRFARKTGRLVVSFALLFILGLDVCTHVPRQNPTVPTRDYAPLTAAMTQAPRLGESRAMLNREVQILLGSLYHPDLEKMFLAQRTLLFSDCNLLDEIPKVNGFVSIHIREEGAVARRLYGTNELPRLEEFLGVSQLCTNLFVWHPNTNYQPWATIGQQPVFKDDTGALDAISSADFAPRRVVYLPLESSNQVSATADPNASILSSKFTAEKCDIQTQSGHRTMLVVAQSYYHCWKASVDGASAPLLRANEAFQAIEVPAGKHDVRLTYQDRPFELGAAISVVTLILCLASLRLLKTL